MDSFEYRVTVHPAEAFREMIWFCSREGSCNMEVVTSEQIKKNGKFAKRRRPSGVGTRAGEFRKRRRACFLEKTNF